METKQTVGEWLKQLGDATVSTEVDGIKMMNLLHRIGFGSAVVTCGIVYLEGKGTLEAPPRSVHCIAKMLVEQAEKGGVTA